MPPLFFRLILTAAQIRIDSQVVFFPHFEIAERLDSKIVVLCAVQSSVVFGDKSFLKSLSAVILECLVFEVLAQSCMCHLVVAKHD